MPHALAIGVPYDVFWHLNPKKIKPFQIAHKQYMNELDACIHAWMGNYGMSALGTALSHMFSKTSTAEYIKEPIFTTVVKQKKEENLTEEEKRKRTEQLFLQLKIMGANHNLNKKGSKTE